MKKQRLSLKELYALAKGKPASCCQVDQSSTDEETKKKDVPCCSSGKEKSCC